MSNDFYVRGSGGLQKLMLSSVNEHSSPAFATRDSLYFLEFEPGSGATLMKFNISDSNIVLKTLHDCQFGGSLARQLKNPKHAM